MYLATTAARIVLGALLLVFGADYFFHFMPELPFTEKGGAFLEALLATGYLFPLIKLIEIGCGLLLISGRAVPLALALLSPVVLNIALYHLFLDPNGLLFGGAVSVLQAFLLWRYRSVFRGLLGTVEGTDSGRIWSTDRAHAAQAGPYR